MASESKSQCVLLQIVIIASQFPLYAETDDGGNEGDYEIPSCLR